MKVDGTSYKRTGDKRMLSWLNEGAVLLAITKNKNRPTYVAWMTRLAPELTQSSDEWPEEPEKVAMAPPKKDGGWTKPGMREAARRLCERGILLRAEAVPPKKKVKTPHYTIKPSIETLATIQRSYGSWVIGDMRRTGFTGGFVDGDMDDHLAAVFGASVASVQGLPKAEKDMLSHLARASTRALEVFLNPGFDFKTTGKEKKGRALRAQVRRLRDAMHLAFIAEVVSSPGLKIWEEGWDVKSRISTTVKSGDMSVKLETAFDSKKHSRKPDNVNRKHAKRKAGGKAAHGKSTN